MSYDGRAVANFILDFCEENNRSITHLSLQKISFFCHAWYLVNFDKPLIKHEFEAWKHGPVLQYLYREFRKYDKDPIDGRATGINTLTGRREKVGYNFSLMESDFLYKCVDFYSRLNASQLVELSHASNGPWDNVWNHSKSINPGMLIKNEEIKRYYSELESSFVIQ